MKKQTSNAAATPKQELTIVARTSELYSETQFYIDNEDKPIRIGWTDARRAPMTLELVAWDQYSLLCKTQEGQRVMVKKTAIAFIIEETAEPTGT